MEKWQDAIRHLQQGTRFEKTYPDISNRVSPSCDAFGTSCFFVFPTACSCKDVPFVPLLDVSQRHVPCTVCLLEEPCLADPIALSVRAVSDPRDYPAEARYRCEHALVRRRKKTPGREELAPPVPHSLLYSTMMALPMYSKSPNMLYANSSRGHRSPDGDLALAPRLSSLQYAPTKAHSDHSEYVRGLSKD